MNVTPATHRASFAIGDEAAAKRVVDVLTEIFFEGEAAVAAFEGPDGRWDVTVNFADAPDQDWLRELVSNAASADIAATLAFEQVEAKDWVKASLEDLVPVAAGRFVVHGAHDREHVAANKLSIEIEAALAFGTGTGVLAIAASKALKIGVLASDIDRPSVAVARENARLNETGPFVQVISATGFAAPEFSRAGPFDLVLANILANPLRQLSGPMARHLAPSAQVILSGLLTHQAPAVIAAYRARGLVPQKHLRIDGWSSLLLRKMD